MASREKNAIPSLFYKGNHRAVIELTLDQPTSSYTPCEFPFVVGALVHLGRFDEAERLYLMKQKLIQGPDLVKCRYFLGVGFCRHSFYAKARKYFIENFRDRKKIKDGESQFFIFQGFGFYHYFAGRMPKALVNAEKALNASLETGFLYGRAISMDLKGHTLIQRGQVGPGMQTLSVAEKLAKQLGASWLSEAILVSLLSYQSRFGIDRDSTEKEMGLKLKSLSKQDIYLQSTLYLDLAQEHIRRGRLQKAKEALNECCRIVYASENRRHAALLNLRYAYIHYLEGDPHLALNLIRNALTQIAPEVDVMLELKLRGFEQRLVRELKLEKDSDKSQLIERLSLRIGETVGHRILSRQKDQDLSNKRMGEDPFGDLMDKIHRRSSEAIEEILSTGYYGLLSDAMPETRGGKILYLDLEPGSLTLFDKGMIEHVPHSISKSLRAILLELNRGAKTKSELISGIWKYEYHPLRHDALIYSAIAKLRKTLGKRSHWLEVSETGYQLRTDVRVLSFSSTPQALPVEPAQTTASAPLLNPRQQKILKLLEQRQYIDTMTCRRLFDTSEITASRDLGELLKLLLVKRIGKGRATKYTRGFSENSAN